MTANMYVARKTIPSHFIFLILEIKGVMIVASIYSIVKALIRPLGMGGKVNR